MRTQRDYLLLAGKGILMGAADAVPGVSGGTIAFITGIYAELIHTLTRFNLDALQLLRKGRIRALFSHLNLAFLLPLLAGILTSIALFAHAVTWLLDNQPQLLWAFFFGLIVASIFYLARQSGHWNLNQALMMAFGAVLAWGITSMPPATLDVSPVAVFFSGMLAICAMVLPGISGSFILLILGMYAPVLAAIKGFELDVLGIFAAGAAIGLLSFSHLLAWALRHFYQLTLALLCGFMLGSLNKVWPWKYTTAYRMNSHNEPVPLQQVNVLPDSFEMLTGQPSQLWPALALMLLGAALVLVLDRHSPQT